MVMFKTHMAATLTYDMYHSVTPHIGRFRDIMSVALSMSNLILAYHPSRICNIRYVNVQA